MSGEIEKKVIANYTLILILGVLIVSTAIAVYSMTEVQSMKSTVSHQDKLLANVTALSKMYQELFVQHQIELNQFENFTQTQIAFNIDVGKWAQGIDVRLDRLE